MTVIQIITICQDEADRAMMDMRGLYIYSVLSVIV